MASRLASPVVASHEEVTASPVIDAQEAAMANALGYWAMAPLLGIALICVISIRLPELQPLLRKLHPAILVAYGGAGLLLMNTRSTLVAEVLRHRLVKVAGAYLIWCGATIPTALWQAQGFNILQSLVPAVITTIGVAMCFPSRRTVERLQLAFVVFATAYAIYTRIFGRMWGGRLSGFGMYDSNDMASIFAIAFPLAAGLLVRAKGRARWMAWAGIVYLVLTVVASGSRGGTLALLTGALVFALGVRGSRRFWIIVLFVAGGFATWTTASPQFRSRMMSLTSLEDDYNYTLETGRKAVWRRGRRYAREHPVMGVGLGNFPMAEGQSLAEAEQTGKWSNAHNAYVQAFAELGVPGGTIFVLMLLTGARIGYGFARGRQPLRRGEMHRPEYLASLAAYSCGAYFLSHAYFPPLFGLLGLIALADRTVERERKTDIQLAWSHQTVTPQRRPGRGGLANGRFGLFQGRSATAR